MAHASVGQRAPVVVVKVAPPTHFQCCPPCSVVLYNVISNALHRGLHHGRWASNCPRALQPDAVEVHTEEVTSPPYISWISDIFHIIYVQENRYCLRFNCPRVKPQILNSNSYQSAYYKQWTLCLAHLQRWKLPGNICHHTLPELQMISIQFLCWNAYYDQHFALASQEMKITWQSVPPHGGLIADHYNNAIAQNFTRSRPCVVVPCVHPRLRTRDYRDFAGNAIW